MPSVRFELIPTELKFVDKIHDELKIENYSFRNAFSWLVMRWDISENCLDECLVLNEPKIRFAVKWLSGQIQFSTKDVFKRS